MNEKRALVKVALTAGLTILAWLGTMFVRIPILATSGYFNIGDIFVILAGLWLGPRSGLVVGLVGPAIADAIGYPQYILATAITKGIEGLLVGLVAGQETDALWRKWVAALGGGLIMVLGYFMFEAYVYPTLGRSVPFFAVTTYADAVVEIGPNLAQATIGIVVAVGVWKGLEGRKKGRLKTEHLDA